MAGHKPSKLDVVGSNPTGVASFSLGFPRASEQRSATKEHEPDRPNTNENGPDWHQAGTKLAPGGDGSPALFPASRSMELALADLVETFDSLPLNNPRRGPLAVQIRDLEIELDHRAGAR
jgi:hypothetical protein